MFRNKLLFISLIILGFTACKGDVSGLIPDAGGKPGEIVIVIDEQELKSKWVDSIRTYLSRPMPVLPQEEPYWKVFRSNSSHFQSLFRVHRNVVRFQINPQQKEAAYKVENNLYANGQVLVTVVAENSAELLEYWAKVATDIEEILRKNDFKLLAKEYNKIVNRDAQKAIEEVIGLKVSIPKGYSLGIDTTDFVYYLNEGLRELKTDRGAFDGKIQRSLWFATGEYTNENIFSREGALNVRDSIAQKYILGYKEGSYMLTERLVPTDSLSIEFNGQRGFVQRGLWKMSTEFKGGPFINIVSYNPDNQKWIMLEGFVYAPQFDKREYMLQVEGIIKSATK